MKYKVAFLGVGRMASAIIRNIVDKGVLRADEIVGTHHNEITAKKLNQELNIDIIVSNNDAVNNAKHIFLCTRPLQIRDMAGQIDNCVTENHIIASVAIGVPIAFLQKLLPSAKHIIHIHPTSLLHINSPGISFSAFDSNTNYADVSEVLEIFNPLGGMKVIQEKEIKYHAIFTGCSPAYFSYILLVWEKLAIDLGLSKQDAEEIIASIVSGISVALNENQVSFESIIENIATPNGATQAGIDSLVKQGVDKLLHSSVAESILKIEQLRDMFGENSSGQK